ncbi:hypothetical protein IQ07DRAFT_585228 [Pyrenochaeta sp. DS3sAY3a]|nr:hypothetical protein IQ07DRAFT_585228 [Pyrenochaeta sp. DS3sAY3a]
MGHRLIDAANRGVQQVFFRSSFKSVIAPHEYHDRSMDDLSTGILNYFTFEDGRWNCTDAVAVFGDAQPFAGGRRVDGVKRMSSPPLNFWSCAFFPNLTRDYREARLPDSNVTFLDSMNVDTSLTNSTHVTSFLSTCLSAWCGNSVNCSSSSCDTTKLTINGTLLSAQETSTCVTEICTATTERVSNSDITGIGVITSIFIQFVIAFIGALIHACVFVFFRLIRSKFSLLLGPGVHESDTGLARDEEEAHPWSTELVQSLVAMLDEFQRTQCCFAITVVVASYMTLKARGRQMTQVDKDAISIVSMSGIIPTTAVFATLLGVKQRDSQYTRWLTYFTWILSLVVRFDPLAITRTETTSGYLGSQPDACGMKPPIYICGQSRPNDQLASLTAATALCMIIMAVIILLHIFGTVRSRNLRREGHSRFPYAGDPVRHIDPSYLGVSASLLVIFMIISVVLYFIEVAEYMQAERVNMEWSFGQIVAATIWLPTLLNFFNDCIFGPIKSRTNQLPDSLEVVSAFTRGMQSTETLRDLDIETVVARRRRFSCHSEVRYLEESEVDPKTTSVKITSEKSSIISTYSSI